MLIGAYYILWSLSWSVWTSWVEGIFGLKNHFATSNSTNFGKVLDYICLNYALRNQKYLWCMFTVAKLNGMILKALAFTSNNQWKEMVLLKMSYLVFWPCGNCGYLLLWA
jgi:hypothetical protein